MADIIENQKPDVYDIAVDTGDGIYWTAEVVHFQQNDNVRKIQVRIPQQGAQLLQQGEAVATINKNGLVLTQYGYEHPQMVEGALMYLGTLDTQRKLDKAREALLKISQLKSPTLNSLATETAQQALKDIS